MAVLPGIIIDSLSFFSFDGSLSAFGCPVLEQHSVPFAAGDMYIELPEKVMQSTIVTSSDYATPSLRDAAIVAARDLVSQPAVNITVRYGPTALEVIQYNDCKILKVGDPNFRFVAVTSGGLLNGNYWLTLQWVIQRKHGKTS